MKKYRESGDILKAVAKETDTPQTLNSKMAEYKP